jgi:hypothetical protein
MEQGKIDRLNQAMNTEPTQVEDQCKTSGWSPNSKRSNKSTSGYQKRKKKGLTCSPNEGVLVRRSKRLTKQTDHPIEDAPARKQLLLQMHVTLICQILNASLPIYVQAHRIRTKCLKQAQVSRTMLMQPFYQPFQILLYLNLNNFHTATVSCTPQRSGALTSLIKVVNR